ncbi:MAG: hypothetical protein WA029_21775, partial [Anaerolineae bacterium]
PVGQPNPTWGSEYRTRYSYDVAGRLLTVQDHASNQTTLTHDLLGRKTSMNDPDMGAWQYRYDAVGNLVPNPENPQNLNRYSYALNNSIRFSDPSGHAAVCGTSVDGGCGTMPLIVRSLPATGDLILLLVVAFVFTTIGAIGAGSNLSYIVASRRWEQEHGKPILVKKNMTSS